MDFTNKPETALYLFNNNSYAVVIVEMAFPDLSGLIMIQQWRNHDVVEKRYAGYIVSAGNRNDRQPEESNLIDELTGIQTIHKPFTAVQLLPYLQRAHGMRLKNQKFAELSHVAKTIGRERVNLDKALQLIRIDLPSIGLKGITLMHELYERHGMWENALSLVNHHLGENPNDIGLLNSKGKILLSQGRVEEALECMEIADRMAPQNIERINSMAIAYLEAQKPDLAVPKIKQLIDYHPDQPSLKFDLFSQLYDRGFDGHARKLCKETSHPMEVVRHYNNLGVALAKAGKVDRALIEYKRCLEFYPKFKENYRIYYNITLATLSYQTRDHYEQALGYVSRCLELNPNFEKAQKTLSLIKEKLEGKKNNSQKRRKFSLVDEEIKLRPSERCRSSVRSGHH